MLVLQNGHHGSLNYASTHLCVVTLAMSHEKVGLTQL